jgi:RimJ/RimL family protein N-acetyltransferase
VHAPRELRTPRLVLRAPQALCLDDLAAAFVESLNLSLPGLRFISWGQQPRSIQWAQGFVASSMQHFDRGEDLTYYAFEHDHGGHWGRYVGRIDLHSWELDTPRCEVGYVGDVRTAGLGLMREAVLACVELAFQLGAARVQALSEAGNQRALHFAEHALGFKREGLLHNYERDAQGNLGDQVMFAAYAPTSAAG